MEKTKSEQQLSGQGATPFLKLIFMVLRQTSKLEASLKLGTTQITGEDKMQNIYF
jgi:hypothetical protein